MLGRVTKWNNKKPVSGSIQILKETCKIQDAFESIDLARAAALLIAPNNPLLHPNPIHKFNSK